MIVVTVAVGLVVAVVVVVAIAAACLLPLSMLESRPWLRARLA